MKKTMLLVAALLMVPLMANAAGFEEGVHFKVINPGPGSAKPVITEFFSFFCSHCYNFQKTVVPTIKRTLPKGVTFDQTHVEFIGGPMGEKMSQAYAIAEQLGVLDKIEPALFSAIHEKRQPFDSLDDIRNLFIANGVSGKDFDAAVNSFMVDSQVAKMRKDTNNAGIRGVPSLVVNDKYLVMPDNVKSYQDMLDIAYYLAQKKP